MARSTPPASPRPASASIADVLTVARVIGRLTDADDEALAAALRDAGLSALDAELALALVPLAFGRVAFQQMGSVPRFAPIYLVETAKGTRVARSIAAEPWYQAAAEVAQQFSASRAPDVRPSADPRQPTRTEFQAVLARSPEVVAARNLLKGGGEPGDLVFVEPLFMRIPAESFGAHRAWWRFW